MSTMNEAQLKALTHEQLRAFIQSIETPEYMTHYFSSSKKQRENIKNIETQAVMLSNRLTTMTLQEFHDEIKGNSKALADAARELKAALQDLKDVERDLKCAAEVLRIFGKLVLAAAGAVAPL